MPNIKVATLNGDKRAKLKKKSKLKSLKRKPDTRLPKMEPLVQRKRIAELRYVGSDPYATARVATMLKRIVKDEVPTVIVKKRNLWKKLA